MEGEEEDVMAGEVRRRVARVGLRMARTRVKVAEGEGGVGNCRRGEGEGA